MKTLRWLTWGSARFWVSAIAMVAAALLVARDSTPASAVTTEILPSISGTSPTYQSSALLVKGGHLALNIPCVPGDTDPTTLCLYIWAKNVNNSTGASAAQVHYTYPASQLMVSAAGGSPAWLGSSGRSVSCPAGVFFPGDGVFECYSVLPPPPFGATGNGIIGTLAIESQNVIGPAVFTLTSDTFLVDTPVNPDDQTQIPATVRSISIFVAPCADFTGGDDKVTVADIIFVLNKYHTNDPGADLDGSGMVLVNDILIGVAEFGMLCSR